jgi:hypothetical protein
MELKPSGRIGLRLGYLGFSLFILVFLYPLRKHWRALGRIGKTRNWFNCHVFLGLAAPLIVTFHSAFKIGGFAGMAYWTMAALVASGIVGRYIYAQIPRNISAAEMSLKEMIHLKETLLAELKSQTAFALSDIERLFHLPTAGAVESMSLMRALSQMALMDFVRPFRIWRFKNQAAKMALQSHFPAGVLTGKDKEFKKAISLVSRESKISVRILFLSKTQQVFHMWHIVHRPFSISFAVFVIIHVAVALWLGYF